MSSPTGGPIGTPSVNEWLAARGLGAYVWAFACQGFEGPECLRNLASLTESQLDQLAVQTSRKAEEALGVTAHATLREPMRAPLTSSSPGLRIEIEKTRTSKRGKGKAFTEYAVDVFTVDRRPTAQSWHRFSDFDDLGRQIASASQTDLNALPKLPPKKAGKSTSDVVVKERMTQLSVYVGRLLVACPSHSRPLLDAFLALSSADTDSSSADAPRQVEATIHRDAKQAAAVDASDEESHLDHAYDPARSYTVQQALLEAADDSDASAHFNEPIKLLDDYFSANAPARFVKGPDTRDVLTTAPSECLDLKRGLQNLGLAQYTNCLRQHDMQNPDVWADFDDEAWEDFFESVGVATEHRASLLCWFMDPLALNGSSGEPRQRSESIKPASPSAASQDGDRTSADATQTDVDPREEGKQTLGKLARGMLSPPRPLQQEPDRALGAGFGQGAALPRPIQWASVRGGGCASGPLFSVVYTDGGTTHAWSQTGATDMRAACSNPQRVERGTCHDAHCRGTSAHSSDRWGDMTAPRLQTPWNNAQYKLINDAHSQTIGPNMSNCISTLIDSYKQDAETLQAVRGILQQEALKSTRDLQRARRGAIVLPATWAEASPLCSVSQMPLSTRAAADGTTAVVAMQSGECVRDAYLDIVMQRSKSDHSSDAKPESESIQSVECFVQGIKELRQQELDVEARATQRQSEIKKELADLQAEWTTARMSSKVTDETAAAMADRIRPLVQNLNHVGSETIRNVCKLRQLLDQRSRHFKDEFSEFLS